MTGILIALAMGAIWGVYKGARAAIPLWKQGQRTGIILSILLVLAGIPLQAVLYRQQAAQPNLWLASTLLLLTLCWLFSGFILMVFAKKRLENQIVSVWPANKNAGRALGYGAAMIAGIICWILGYRGLIFSGGKYEGVMVVLVLYVIVVAGRGLIKCYQTNKLGSEEEQAARIKQQTKQQAKEQNKGQAANQNKAKKSGKLPK